MLHIIRSEKRAFIVLRGCSQKWWEMFAQSRCISFDCVTIARVMYRLLGNDLVENDFLSMNIVWDGFLLRNNLALNLRVLPILGIVSVRLICI